MELVSAGEAHERFPLMDHRPACSARSGSRPTATSTRAGSRFALAEGARRRGAEVDTGTRVTAIGVERGRVTHVVTDRGTIEAEVVVNAGGMYAPEIGAPRRRRPCRSCRWRTST